MKVDLHVGTNKELRKDSSGTENAKDYVENSNDCGETTGEKS